MIVSVAPLANWFRATAPVSAVRSEVILTTTFPATPTVLIDANNPPTLVSEVNCSPLQTEIVPLTGSSAWKLDDTVSLDVLASLVRTVAVDVYAPAAVIVGVAAKVTVAEPPEANVVIV